MHAEKLLCDLSEFSVKYLKTTTVVIAHICRNFLVELNDLICSHIHELKILQFIKRYKSAPKYSTRPKRKRKNW